ncbi:MAG: polynucleotide adenylyltransferase PcnB [Gammaproteobacteria bacterium]|nr:polynucleotide adenylyltransferase PcnB [Gammaproteobacteria bacterium]MDH4256904.1 polynucleotide adenylyltransferase PcnB [Gammaproteobacteria bacterium]MDH5311612.1 polynucleotide adenylyltransferase PcnB [Gammaproteobacteria bacterium]
MTLKNEPPTSEILPQIIPRAEHNISRDDISKNALKVLYRLHNAGYQAFLVGGCVRDELLELHPKDFDVATNAHPEEIKALFGNCRLIGRRFRLAHVRFGQEVIEVATFRASVGEEEDHADAVQDTHGRILRDNVYGTIEEDVWRRDFTCNALYYNIADFSVWDYVGGVEHIRQRRLVLIGDPERRLREDPVRMLRAVRFAAKLDFTVDPAVEQAMHDCVGRLASVPPARLFDEFLKMFQGGHAERTFELLWHYRLFDQLFPETARELDRSESFGRFVKSALVNTDRRVAEGKSVTPMFLLGVFFWEPVRIRASKMLDDEGGSETHALAVAAFDLSGAQQRILSIPKRFTGPMREMLALQPRFEVMRGRRGLGLLEHRRFRAAYDFLMLRAEAGDADEQTAKFWTDVQLQSAEEREKSFEISGPGRKSSKKRKPRRRRRPANQP